jgi:hypothetical protein
MKINARYTNTTSLVFLFSLIFPMFGAFEGGVCWGGGGGCCYRRGESLCYSDLCAM